MRSGWDISLHCEAWKWTQQQYGKLQTKFCKHEPTPTDAKIKGQPSKEVELSTSQAPCELRHTFTMVNWRKSLKGGIRNPEEEQSWPSPASCFGSSSHFYRSLLCICCITRTQFESWKQWSLMYSKFITSFKCRGRGPTWQNLLTSSHGNLRRSYGSWAELVFIDPTGACMNVQKMLNDH
jgi:hypothetical protein